MDHSFEEIRAAAIDLLARRETTTHDLSQYQTLLVGVGEVFGRRENPRGSAAQTYAGGGFFATATLSRNDQDLFLEVFWTLFREGIITLGMNDANREFPFFRVTQFGQRILSNQESYFFHDVSSYENAIKVEIPSIDDVTLIYLKEAMQSFRTGCVLASSVMLGVATEHTFLLLLEQIEQNQAYSATFASVSKERMILTKVNKFKAILDQQLPKLPSPIKEDLDTHFAGILSIIRTFRNQSGHPSGKIIDREQCYVLLQLFIPYGKKMYQLMSHYA